MVRFLNVLCHMSCHATCTSGLSECGTSELNSWMGVRCTVRETSFVLQVMGRLVGDLKTRLRDSLVCRGRLAVCVE